LYALSSADADRVIVLAALPAIAFTRGEVRM